MLKLIVSDYEENKKIFDHVVVPYRNPFSNHGKMRMSDLREYIYMENGPIYDSKLS